MSDDTRCHECKEKDLLIEELEATVSRMGKKLLTKGRGMLEIDKLNVYEMIYNRMMDNGIIKIPEFIDCSPGRATAFLRDLADAIDEEAEIKYPDGTPF